MTLFLRHLNRKEWKCITNENNPIHHRNPRLLRTRCSVRRSSNPPRNIHTQLLTNRNIMWIIPSQLLNSAPDMAALDLASKTSLANDCDASHIVSLRGLLKPISSVKWKKDSWMSHLFGTILKPSLTENFTDWWTSSLQDTLVNRSQPLASEQERKTQDTCGLGSQTEFGFSDQECAFSRMSKDTSRWDSPASSATWKSWVTRCRGEYSARVKSAHLTSASGCSSWATPTALLGSMYAERNALERNSMSLASQASLTTWPTPIAKDWKGCGNAVQRKDGKHRLDTLEAVVMFGLPAPANPSTDGSRPESWATPIMGDSHLASTPEVAQKRIEEGKVTLSRQNPGKLNPRWVETLMGLPIGWTMPSCTRPVIIAPTNCDCLETESSQPPQNERLGLF